MEQYEIEIWTRFYEAAVGVGDVGALHRPEWFADAAAELADLMFARWTQRAGVDDGR